MGACSSLLNVSSPQCDVCPYEKKQFSLNIDLNALPEDLEPEAKRYRNKAEIDDDSEEYEENESVEEESDDFLKNGTKYGNISPSKSAYERLEKCFTLNSDIKKIAGTIGSQTELNRVLDNLVTKTIKDEYTEDVDHHASIKFDLDVVSIDLDLDRSYSDYSHRESEDGSNTSVSFSRYPVHEMSMKDTNRSITRSKILYSIVENPELENKDPGNSPYLKKQSNRRITSSMHMNISKVTNEESTDERNSNADGGRRNDESPRNSNRRSKTEKPVKDAFVINGTPKRDKTFGKVQTGFSHSASGKMMAIDLKKNFATEENFNNAKQSHFNSKKKPPTFEIPESSRLKLTKCE